jgi:hypothetical protein
VTQASEPSEAVRPGRWRTPVARLLTVLGALLLVVSVAANFVERQALDTGEFEETARQLLSDEDIQRRVAATMTDQLYANVDVEAALRERLPPQQDALAGPLAGALRPATEALAARVLDRERFQELWVQSFGAAQQQVVRILDDEARFVETEGGVVAIDLRPLLVQLSEQIRIVPDLSSRLPEDAGVIRVFEAEQLDTAQTLTRLLRAVAAWIWVLALALWVAAVFIARDRRKEIRAIAVAFVVVGVLVLAVRDLAGRYLVDELAASPTQEDSVQSVWDILTRLLADAGWAGIAVGVVALVGVWLFGPSTRGTAVRRALAPYLENAALTYGVAAFAFLVVFLWGPISYVQRPLVILVFAVLAALGIEALRRKAAGEVADATSG